MSSTMHVYGVRLFRWSQIREHQVLGSNYEYWIRRSERQYGIQWWYTMHLIPKRLSIPYLFETKLEREKAKIILPRAMTLVTSDMTEPILRIVILVSCHFYLHCDNVFSAEEIFRQEWALHKLYLVTTHASAAVHSSRTCTITTLTLLS